jgi:hypothetical protein
MPSRGLEPTDLRFGAEMNTVGVEVKVANVLPPCMPLGNATAAETDWRRWHR